MVRHLTHGMGAKERDEFLRAFKRQYGDRVLAPDVNPHIAMRDLREYLAKGRLTWARPTEYRRTSPRVAAALRMRDALAEVERLCQ